MQELTGIAERLRTAIEAAWQDAMYPGDRFVFAGRDNEDALEQEMMGKHWRDLELAFTQRLAWGDALALLRPEALHYYLPAFLLLGLTDSSAQGGVAGVLSPGPRKWRSPESLEKFWQRVDLLTDQQRRVIGSLWGYWRDRSWLTDEEWSNALEYWEPYVPGAGSGTTPAIASTTEEPA